MLGLLSSIMLILCKQSHQNFLRKKLALIGLKFRFLRGLVALANGKLIAVLCFDVNVTLPP